MLTLTPSPASTHLRGHSPPVLSSTGASKSRTAVRPPSPAQPQRCLQPPAAEAAPRKEAAQVLPHRVGPAGPCPCQSPSAPARQVAANRAPAGTRPTPVPWHGPTGALWDTASRLVCLPSRSRCVADPAPASPHHPAPARPIGGAQSTTLRDG